MRDRYTPVFEQKTDREEKREQREKREAFLKTVPDILLRAFTDDELAKRLVSDEQAEDESLNPAREFLQTNKGRIYKEIIDLRADLPWGDRWSVDSKITHRAREITGWNEWNEDTSRIRENEFRPLAWVGLYDWLTRREHPTDDQEKELKAIVAEHGSPTPKLRSAYHEAQRRLEESLKREPKTTGLPYLLSSLQILYEAENGRASESLSEIEREAYKELFQEALAAGEYETVIMLAKELGKELECGQYRTIAEAAMKHGDYQTAFSAAMKSEDPDFVSQLANKFLRAKRLEQAKELKIAAMDWKSREEAGQVA